MFATHPVGGSRAAFLARLRPPGVCAVCRSWGSGRICAACCERFAAPTPRCRRCALPFAGLAGTCGACIAQPPPFDAALARLDYAYPWDRLVAAFKFRGALDLAHPFAEAIVDAHRRAGGDVDGCKSPDRLADPAATPPPAADTSQRLLLLPVPLSAERLRERGFNQAWQLARRVARRVGADADPRLLLRIRDTPHQLDLPTAERAGNVRGAFAVEPRRLREMRGRRIAVIDDVMTTGSTLAEIASVLKAAGASSVAVWVVARTPRPEDA